MSQWYSSSPTAYSPADVKFSDKIATSNPYHLDAHKEVARFPTSSLNSSHDGGCGTADSDKIAQQKTGDQEFPTHTTQHTPGISMYDGLEVRSPPAIPLKSPKRQSHGASDLIPLHDHATGEDPEFPTEVLKQQPFTRRRKVIIIGALCLLLAVAVGAALGAVFGTRRKSGSSRPSTDASSSPTTGTNPSTTSPAVHSVRTDSSIAAVSFVDESNTMQYRLYFQDAGDGIRKSSYNASGGKWYLSNPSVAKDAKPGSPLAAASLAPNDLASDKAGNGLAKSKPPGPITTIYYLDKSNVVHEIVTRDSGATWQNGSITERNIVANEGSRLSATFHSLSTCENCPNTRLMVYQSIDGQLQLLNGTIDGQESQSYALNTTAVKHTGLAVTLRWKADFIPGIRIYYQAQNGDAVAQWWEEPANWALQNGLLASPLTTSCVTKTLCSLDIPACHDSGLE